MARLSGGAGAAAGCGVTAPGRGGGGAPRREVRCDSSSGAAGSARCEGPGRDRGKPGVPGEGLLGGAQRRGGELAVCRGALRSCRRGFPRYSGVPPRLSQKPDRERSSTCDCAGVSSGVSADWKPLCAVRGEPRGARHTLTSGWRSSTPGPARPAEPAGSAAPPGQPPGTSTFLAPGRGRWVEGVPCFE